MLALHFDKKLGLVDCAVPECPEGNALIRVLLAGICNTDLEILRGYMQYYGTLGHEFVGTVQSCSEDAWIGKRVTGEINLGCGCCSWCHSGLSRHCPNRSVLGILHKDGAMAEYVTLPIGNLVQVPDSVSDEEAVFIEPLAASCEILEQVHIRPADKVAIIGDGKMAALIAQVLKLTGGNIHLFGKHEEKYKRIQKFGIDCFPVSALPENQFDWVIEVTGDASGLFHAIQTCKPRGSIVLKSTIATPYQINLAELVIKEITLVGSRCGPFKPAIRMLMQKLIDVEPLITATYELSQWKTAFNTAESPEAMKVLLRMTSP